MKYNEEVCGLYDEPSDNEKELVQYTHQESPNENYFEELNDYLDGTMAR